MLPLTESKISVTVKRITKVCSRKENENTVKKTSTDMKCFYRFLGEINTDTNVQILDLPPEELDHLLGKFFKDVRKNNGEEYEPSTLTGLQRGIQGFLPDSGSKMNILKDDEFAFSPKVLEAKRKNLVVQGKGNRPNAIRSLNDKRRRRQVFSHSVQKIP